MSRLAALAGDTDADRELRVRLDRVFSAIDKQGSGYLTIKELKLLVQSTQGTLSEEGGPSQEDADISEETVGRIQLNSSLEGVDDETPISFDQLCSFAAGPNPGGVRSPMKRSMSGLKSVAHRARSEIEVTEHVRTTRHVVSLACFEASQLVDWLLASSSAPSLAEAIKLAKDLEKLRLIIPVEVKFPGSNASSRALTVPFEDGRRLSRFNDWDLNTLKLIKPTEVTVRRKEFTKQLEEVYLERLQLQGKSLGIFGQDNCFRKFCRRAIVHPWFEGAIQFFIAVSSVMLALEQPRVQPHTSTGRFLAIGNIVLTGIFTLEMSLKIVAYGFLCNGSHSYLRDNWNRLDAAAVTVSLLDLVLMQLDSDMDLSFLKIIRMLRVLRPLRMMQRAPGLRQVINTIIDVLPSTLNVMAILAFFMFMFALVFVSFFSGRFAYCDGAEDDKWTLDKDECTGFVNVSGFDEAGDYQTTVVARQWTKENQNFDNVFSAMLSLFELATLEMWPDIMDVASDATEKGEHPKYKSNPVAYFLVILYVIFGSFFLFNLFGKPILPSNATLYNFLSSQWASLSTSLSRAGLRGISALLQRINAAGWTGSNKFSAPRHQDSMFHRLEPRAGG